MTDFVHDGIPPVTESSPGGTGVLLRALGVDDFLLRIGPVSTAMFLTEARGSLVATTDAAGGVQSEVTYEPFGNTEMSAPAPAYRFTGREDDEPLYLYYYRARYYHTDLQRFISEDPIGFAGGDPDLYAYVGNNPLSFRDPLGLWCPECHYRQTLAVGLECGLSAKNAEALAEATKMVDRENVIETLKPHSPRHGMPNSDWRGYAAGQLDAAITGRGASSMKALARGIHTVQDAWAHDLRFPKGTISEHFYSPDPRWRSPDDPDQNPWEWEMSRRATTDYISSFMRGRGKEPKCGTGL